MESNRKLLGMDYSGIELRVFAELARKGEFDNMEPKRNFSQIYGTKKAAIENLYPEQKTNIRMTTLTFLKQYPKAVEYIPGLRKVKTRAMVEALRFGHYDNGNHFMTCYEFVYHFFYRGTLIFKWDAVNDDYGQLVYAGEYEDTASTRNQRKEIQKAIENFKEAVLNL